MAINYQMAKEAAAVVAKAGIVVYAAAGAALHLYTHEGNLVIVDRPDTYYARPAGTPQPVRYLGDANLEGDQMETDAAWEWIATASATATATNPAPV